MDQAADTHIQQPLLAADSTGGKSEAEHIPDPDEVDPLTVESLDYDPVHNTIFAHSKRQTLKRHLFGYTGLTFEKWTITIVVGLLVGFLAYIVSTCQEMIMHSKKHLAQEFIVNSGGFWSAFLVFSVFGIVLVIVASCVVLYWAPAAAGGGVTLVMAYLNGNDIPNFFKFETLIAKIIGTICTISSGLPLGQEGPMVHIGGAVASTLTWMHCQFFSCESKGFHNDKDRREFISAGTAAGLAAAFGAPVGGVLFSLEEASSFWSRKVMWRSLVCTSMATLVIAWLHDRGFSFALPSNLSFRLQPEFNVQDLPLVTLTSLGAGIMGALLNISHSWLLRWRPAADNKLKRLAEACVVTLICIAAMCLLAHFFGRCLPVQEDQEQSQSRSDSYWFQYTCKGNHLEADTAVYNDLATMYFSLPHETIQKLLEIAGDAQITFTIRSLGINAISFSIMFFLSYGIATPGGIFMPSLMVGASFGALVGQIYESLFPSANVRPGLHALVGASAMLAGVFRTSISLVVIIVEGTGGIEFILPVILSIVVSNYIAHFIHPSGAYEADLEQLGDVYFLHSEPSQELIRYTAIDIMSEDPVTLQEVTLVSDLNEILRTCRHNGFPVLREGEFGGQLAGLILRHQLLVLIEERAFIEVDLQSRTIPEEKDVSEDDLYLDNAMRVYHHRHYAHRRDLSSRPEAVEQLLKAPVPIGPPTPAASTTAESKATKPEPPKKAWAVDLRPFMNRAPLTVRAECSAHRIFIIFRTLGLRHLCVTDSYDRVIGMLTRKDLAQARKTAAARSGRTMRGARPLARSDTLTRKDLTGQEALYNLP